MDGVAIGLGLLIAGAGGAFVAWPWWTKRQAFRPETGSRVSSGEEALDERREAVLTALRDLEFDQAVGKVADEDYKPLRQALLVEAADIITRLDEKQATAQSNIDARVEAELMIIHQELNAEPSNNICPLCGRPARRGDVYCAGCGAQLNATCSTCGRGVRSADLYCTGCGAELVLAAS